MNIVIKYENSMKLTNKHPNFTLSYLIRWLTAHICSQQFAISLEFIIENFIKINFNTISLEM